MALPLLSEPPAFTADEYSTLSQVPYKRDDQKEFEGSYSLVYRATRGDAKEMFVVKKISLDRPGTKATPDALIAEIESEISILRRCADHPNLAKFIAAYTVEDVKDYYFIVMQPWAPLNLAHFLNKVTTPGHSSICPWWNDLSDFDKCHVPFSGILEGLWFLHNQLIFHKDVKPENILFDGSTAILTDFGVSKLYKPRNPTNYTRSTYSYLAPEQVSHEQSSPQSDMFSMGCCFLQLFLATTGGRDSLRRFDDIVLDRSGQYARELAEIFPAFKQKIAPLMQTSTGILGLFVRDMLLEDPRGRPSSWQAKNTLYAIFDEEIRPDSKMNYRGDVFSLSECIQCGIFDVHSISILNSAFFDELEHAHQWRARIVDENGNAEEVDTVSSLDSGTRANVISADFLKELQEKGHHILQSQLDRTVVTHVAGQPSTFKVSILLPLILYVEGDIGHILEVKVNMRFLVAHDMVTFFTLLLGSSGIRRLDQEIHKQGTNFRWSGGVVKGDFSV
jgi:serine/threonine protein kinase